MTAKIYAALTVLKFEGGTIAAWFNGQATLGSIPSKASLSRAADP